MSLDLSSVGYQTEPIAFEYDWKDTVLYALSIGAKRDELDYLYEARGPKVFPTFVLLAGFEPVSALFEKTRCDLTRLVHSRQMLTLHRRLPPQGKLVTVAGVKGIYDMIRMALVEFHAKTTLDGELCAESGWFMAVLGEGGFRGPRPPRSALGKVPSDREPDFSQTEVTGPEQALLYRLNGDTNPLHADPAFAVQAGFDSGPILHGLCTFGYLARAIVRHTCGGDGDRLASLQAEFRKPVWPGESLRSVGYRVGNAQVAAEVFAGDRDKPVVTSAWATVQ